MSDDALQKLVSRLVEVGGELGGEDADTTAEPQSPGHARALIMGSTSEQAAAPSDSAESSGDEELVSAATGQPIWPSLAQDQPSPIQAPRGTPSPRADGYDREADLLASAHASDCSSEGGEGGRALAEVVPLAAIATRAVEQARVETDSCGYEGDVGEGAKRMTPSFRRAAGIAPPGFSTNKDGAEADDEASGREATKSHVPQQPASLDMSARGMISHYGGRVNPSQANEGSPWDALNESLREQGFREVSLSRPGGSIAVPDPTSLADTLRDVVFKHGERGKVIQEMSLELQRRDNVGGHRESMLNESFRRERSDLSKRSAGAEARAAALEAENKRLQDQLALESRRAKAENASLASQLKQSEHRVKAKEAAAQKLMDKLQDEAEKERLSQQRERAILTKFRQNEAAAATAVSRGGVGGGGGANDSRLAESLIAHSKAQERSEAETDKLRAEISRLGDELREKENTILKHRLGPDWTPDLDPNDAPVASDELRGLRDRLAESERSVRVMKQREARALERCASMEKECAEVQAKADETQDALVNARLELSSRPSLRNWRASQRRIQDLETKLGQATSQAKEAMDVAELRRWVDTRELMRRDRGNHRLKLDRLEELPTAVLKQVVQDTCRLLSLQDVSLLGSSVSKLIKAVQMLPRLERFVNSVCGFVFRHSTEVLSAPSDGMLSQALAGKARTMEDVLPLLELWLARAQEPVKLKEFHRGVLRVLETRAGESQVSRGDGSVFKSDRAATSAIQHLVDFERRSLQEMHLNEQADRSIKDDPSPVNRVVQHFQLLFGVSSLGGCLPKLNELYRFSSETKTFLRTCGDLINMPEASGSEAIMRRLETILEGTVDTDADTKLRVSHDAESWAGQSIELAAEA
ncbi:unnamed protein product [Ectocarpus fasciculatus]